MTITMTGPMIGADAAARALPASPARMAWGACGEARCGEARTGAWSLAASA